MRLDAHLAASGQARSRSQAATLIRAGKVKVGGQTVTKPAFDVAESAQIEVERDPWVSRGAHKLLGALEESGLGVPARVLDAGASTGGFTQVLLHLGAQVVYAVDVGHDQLDASIRRDSRVRVREGLNLRELTLADLDGDPVGLVVADVSFISLTMLLDPLLAVVDPQGRALLMVKPQYEVGRKLLGSGGVVRSAELREQAVAGVVAAANMRGWGCFWQSPSRLPGPSGNVEYFIGLARDKA